MKILKLIHDTVTWSEDNVIGILIVLAMVFAVWIFKPGKGA